MNIKDTIQNLINFDIPLSKIAKSVNKDAGFLKHWLNGEVNISADTSDALQRYIEEKRAEWEKIFVEDNNS